MSPALAATPATSGSGGQIACNGPSCSGLDPARTVSSLDGYLCLTGAYTPWDPSGIARFATSQGIVELRYSPHCHANWARITKARPGAGVWVQNWNNEMQQQYVPQGRSSTYTAMVNGYTTSRAGDSDGFTTWY
ncbi:DUF2690 domain-containing protein [Streptomyces sp. NPDC007205]|uniref:DUF2690 domain-containing protein n=1 Tax=Streptomyces sp. NPDC007205 TaxID=3154316 RepID=UPI0033CE8521